MKVKKIHVKNYEDLQQLLETYEIPFASNITQVMLEILSIMASKDVPSVTITLNDQIVPESYKYNACIWAKHFEGRVAYSHVRSYRPRGKAQVCIYAGMESFQPNFYKSLKTRLTETDVVSYKLDNVPKAYQTNPHILVHRLRVMGTETKATITKDTLTIRRK